ncbi:HDIG domain-containing protein [Candidatus Fermentibacteria bacterium]|nr:HDIG domain-containing protein [Candidatus Fermentibacteria bacterium]
MTGSGISREKAVELLEDKVPTVNLRKHCLATEAIMRALARRLGEDEELWGITGLLHDLDYETTSDRPDRHGLAAAEMLRDRLPEESLHAIKAHNAEHTGVERSSKLDHLLAASESLTGLIVATALVYPGKKLEPVKVRSITKRMGKSGFARSVNRDNIRECVEGGFDLQEFVGISLDAMKGISEQLGL